MAHRLATFQWFVAIAFAVSVTAKAAQHVDQAAMDIIDDVIQHSCSECHNAETSEGQLNLASLPLDLKLSDVRNRWVHIHDRVRGREMPLAPMLFQRSPAA